MLPVRAAKGVTDLRCYPKCYEVFVERLLLFLLGCLLCLLCLLRFLGHVALRDPKSWLNASRQSTCINSNYTIIAKLILRASKRVNDRHTGATCDRTKPSRDAWKQRALPDQDGKKFACGRKTKPTTAKPNHPLARSTAWRISQRLGNGEASLVRRRRQARRRRQRRRRPGSELS